MFPGKTESVNFEGDLSFAGSQRLTTREKKQARENLGLNKDNLLNSFMDLVNIRAEEIYYANSSINENTLRFSFEKMDYNPETDGKGATGTWTKLPTVYSNIWDWTRNDEDWSYSFGAQTVRVEDPKCFQDYNNKVKIIASETSNVVNFGRCFQSCWAITEIWTAFDFSSATEVRNMFSNLWSLVKIQSMYFPVAENARALFQNCKSLEELPYMKFDVCTDFNHYAFECTSLKVSYGFDAPEATDYRDLYEACFALKTITYFGDTSKVQIWHDCFGGCYELENLPDTLDLSAGTDCKGVFSYCMSLKHIPNITWGNNVTTLERFFTCCSNLTEIPDMPVFHYVKNFAGFMSANWDFYNEPRGEKMVPMAIKYLPSWFPQQATNVEDMFYGCKNVENGITTWYLLLSNKITPVTSHDGCFELCGVDTEEGRKQLDNVPDDWK